MEQETLTIAAAVEAALLEPLETLLADLRRDLDPRTRKAAPVVDLRKLGTIHFARFVLIRDERGRPPCLLFATDFDGGRAAHLGALADEVGPGLEQVLAHCTGFRPGRGAGALVRWMTEHAIEPLCTYRGHPGRSVEQIRQERALCDALRRHLASLPVRPGLDARSACHAYVQGASELAPLLDPPPPARLPGWKKMALRARWFAGNTHRLVRAVWRIEKQLAALERADTQAFLDARKAAAAAGKPLHEARKPLLEHEDLDVSNQLTSVAELKPEPLRREILELVLSAAHLRARTRFDRGDLSGIRTIHFARWFLLEEPPGSPHPPRLVFFSNYDGSWERYLGDFVDQAAWKLTAIWANTQGFPPTEDLVFKGADQERWFKEFVRRVQVPTQVWYAAYPDLTVSEVNRNSKLRDLLPKRGGRTEQEAWLRCL
jgi:hypothetical protein